MQFSSLSERILENPTNRIRVADVGVKRLAIHPLVRHPGAVSLPEFASNVAPVDVRVPVYSIHGRVVAERFVQASFPVIE
jgi:hypothetical protein